ncbi:hypothetical protein [Aureimonas pseudogalii]|uniref:Uncharacterized protein n=1 Tax=Aureimonas pseudogalii TaxID=1744844 RepID=A0A7W6EFE9_9HYPH|nr:hypothetical protein [Aureimonas pseudogalii]MBB3996869.1 hypothetical protein [Aureimonas pseudogalii]
MLRLTTLILLTGLSTAQAAQGWITKVEDDVFSDKKSATMLGFTPSGDSVYIECDGDHELEFAVLSKSEDKSPGVPGILVVKIDGGEALRFTAASYAHNDEYVGFKNEDQEQIRSLVKAIGQANKAALFGLQIPIVDIKASLNPGVKGSSKAASQFLEACTD